MHCALCIVHCAAHSLQYTIYGLQCTICIEQCAVFIMQRAVCSMQYSVCSVQFPRRNVTLLVFNMLCGSIERCTWKVTKFYFPGFPVLGKPAETDWVRTAVNQVCSTHYLIQSLFCVVLYLESVLLPVLYVQRICLRLSLFGVSLYYKLYRISDDLLIKRNKKVSATPRRVHRLESIYLALQQCVPPLSPKSQYESQWEF